MNPLDDTIIAISTPPGRGGLGVIRLSGAEALAIAQKIFRPKRPLQGAPRPRCLVLGEVFDQQKQAPLDEAFLAFFPAPNSYTSEDVVELSCHGSPVVLEEAVRLGVSAGARAAEAGEFTLRAYLHGRIDMLQAEAVNDLIEAVCLPQARLSARQARGGLSRRIGELKEGIVETAALIEAAIEFPEEAEVSRAAIEAGLAASLDAVKALAGTYEMGRTMSQGTVLAIVGRSNVGKSTLFNALLDEDRAIVSPNPGTTRDYLKEGLKIGDAAFYLVDTAGLERTGEALDKEGMRRSSRIAAEADGLIIVLDASKRETPADLKILGRYEKKSILIFNKSDLTRGIDLGRCQAAAGGSPWLEISALKKIHLNDLKVLILNTFASSGSSDDEIILHQRQKVLLDQIAEALGAGLELLQAGHAEEVCAEEIRRALPFLGLLTGEIRADDIIADVFRRFCIGK